MSEHVGKGILPSHPWRNFQRTDVPKGFFRCDGCKQVLPMSDAPNDLKATCKSCHDYNQAMRGER
jgi:hypothetical protein